MLSSLGLGDGNTVTADTPWLVRSCRVRMLASCGDVELDGGCLSVWGSVVWSAS